MNNYDDFKKDTFDTYFSTTMIIDLKTKDEKFIYIIFIQTDENDKKHPLIGEVFTAYKHYGSPVYQFGLPCNYGDEMAVRELVIKNYLNDELSWEEWIDDIDNEYGNCPFAEECEHSDFCLQHYGSDDCDV